eukprot:9340213-Pyramimonas_sp.AAC.1
MNARAGYLPSAPADVESALARLPRTQVDMESETGLDYCLSLTRLPRRKRRGPHAALAGCSGNSPLGRPAAAISSGWNAVGGIDASST